MISVSRTTLWRMVQAGTFPQPVRVTKRNRAFLLDAVEAWMKARTDASTTDREVAATGYDQRPMRRGPSSLFAGTARGPGG
jgi:predicted DNA-binding transcriptional regulator AlpA